MSGAPRACRALKITMRREDVRFENLKLAAAASVLATVAFATPAMAGGEHGGGCGYNCGNHGGGDTNIDIRGTFNNNTENRNTNTNNNTNANANANSNTNTNTATGGNA